MVPGPEESTSPTEATQRGREAPGVTREVGIQGGPPKGLDEHAPAASGRVFFLEPRHYYKHLNDYAASGTP